MAATLVEEVDSAAGAALGHGVSFSAPPPSSFSMRNEGLYRKKIASITQDHRMQKCLFDITVSLQTFQDEVPVVQFEYYNNENTSTYTIVVSGFCENIDLVQFRSAVYESHQRVLGARVNPATRNIVVSVQREGSTSMGFSIRGGNPSEEVGGVTAMQACAERHGARIKELASLSSVSDGDANVLRDLALLCYFLQESRPFLSFDFKRNANASKYVVKAEGFSMNLDLAFLYQTFLLGQYKDRIKKVLVNPVNCTLILHVAPEQVCSVKARLESTSSRRATEALLRPVSGVGKRRPRHAGVDKRRPRRSRRLSSRRVGARRHR